MPRQRNHDQKRRHFHKKGFNHPPSGHKREYAYKSQLTEREVGITQYLSPHPGFPGVIKARFSDFQLNEIDLDGNIAKLTDQSIPKDFHIKEQAEKLEKTPIPDLIPQDKWDAIKEMLAAKEKTTVEIDASALDKEARTQIHAALKSSFGKQIFGNTSDKDGTKTMTFSKSDGKQDDRAPKWPEDKGEYVHFLVYKESLDTLEASLKIADCLRMAASNFNYAGVKDKRAKTTQWFSVRKVEPWKLIIKTKSLRNNLKIGNITFKDAPLKLGQLRGNKFRIALRNVVADDELIEKTMQSVKEHGFINYYGLQRFGHDKEVPTFSIGVKLLLGQFKEACDLILRPTDNIDPSTDVAKAKKVYAETKNAKMALEQFDRSKNRCIEYFLLSGLSKENSNEYVNALSSIPRNTRLLYIHALQSLVWNHVASKRIEKYGLKAVEGDLILLEDEPETPDEVEETEEEPNDESKAKQKKVRALSAEECKNYSVYDVVLPLPGYDIVYPEHLKEFYQEILEQHGLALEMTKQRVQTYTLSGAYRKLLQQVKDLSWKIMRYNDPNDNLIRSDLEELRKESEPQTMPDGKYKALVLELTLKASSYATMVLREILKTDTSASSNSKLNNYGEIKKPTPVKEAKEEEIPMIDQHIALLNDKAKYEAFKNAVFNKEATLKRTCDNKDEDKDSDKSQIKKVKVD